MGLKTVNQIIQSLNDQTGLDLNLSKSNLTGGVNNSLYQLIDSRSGKYALKIYPQKGADDLRRRHDAEINFLQYYAALGGKYTPNIICYNIKNKWTLMSWLYGTKPKELKMTDFDAIGSFMHELNSPRDNSIKTNQLKLAADAITSCQTLANDIYKRIYKLNDELSRMERTKSTACLYNWLQQEIPSYASKNISKLLEKADSSHWNDSSLCSIISPSDVGIHNIKKHINNLYFYDFEYAGYDDLSKFFCDWIMQPHYVFSLQQQASFMQIIDKQITQVNNSWIQRVQDIINLNHLKWTLIIAKNEIKKGGNNLNWKKIDDYWQVRNLFKKSLF
ncbi:hypothetical protein [Synechococcus sp. MIT S9452]|uniref:hypothetical protein n=1 Tax=Synechococcus sp. MIT S9452 TaxID=3082546 RepID=UPI0039A4F164